jgi:hypothetical protein
MIASLVEFIEAPLLTQLLHDYPDDENYIGPQLALVRDPEAGDVISEPAASASCGGQTPGGARASVAA